MIRKDIIYSFLILLLVLILSIFVYIYSPKYLDEQWPWAFFASCLLVYITIDWCYNIIKNDCGRPE